MVTRGCFMPRLDQKEPALLSFNSITYFYVTLWENRKWLSNTPNDIRVGFLCVVQISNKWSLGFHSLSKCWELLSIILSSLSVSHKRLRLRVLDAAIEHRSLKSLQWSCALLLKTKKAQIHSFQLKVWNIKERIGPDEAVSVAWRHHGALMLWKDLCLNTIQIHYHTGTQTHTHTQPFRKWE